MCLQVLQSLTVMYFSNPVSTKPHFPVSHPFNFLILFPVFANISACGDPNYATRVFNQVSGFTWNKKSYHLSRAYSVPGTVQAGSCTAVLCVAALTDTHFTKKEIEAQSIVQLVGGRTQIPAPKHSASRSLRLNHDAIRSHTPCREHLSHF